MELVKILLHTEGVGQSEFKPGQALILAVNSGDPLDGRSSKQQLLAPSPAGDGVPSSSCPEQPFVRQGAHSSRGTGTISLLAGVGSGWALEPLF